LTNKALNLNRSNIQVLKPDQATKAQTMLRMPATSVVTIQMIFNQNISQVASEFEQKLD